MTFDTNHSYTWTTYIQELLNKPHSDRTEEENYMLLLADIMELYEDIKEPGDITKEIEEHYFGIKDKELTAIHREIFELTHEERRIEIHDPCRAGKNTWRRKATLLIGFVKY